MKKSYLVVLLVVVIIAISPFIIGQQAETEFRNLYQEMDTSPEFRVEITEYNRNWFNASAKVVISLDLADVDPNENMEIVINHELQHGPILSQSKVLGIGLMDIATRLEFPAFMKEDFPDIDQVVNDTLDIQTRMAFDGSLDNIVNLKEFQFSDEGAQVTVKAGSLEALASKDGLLKGMGRWDGMSVSDNQTFGVTLGASTTDFDLQAIGENLYQAGTMYTGTTNFGMDEIRISANDIPGNIQVTGINMYTNSQVNDNLLSVQWDMGADEVNLMGQAYTDLIFDQSFENLDVALIEQMNQLGQQTQQVSDADLQKLQDLGMQLLAKKPVWKVRKLGITTPQGPIRSEMTIRLNEQMVDMTNPMALPSAIVVDASGYIPEAFINAMGVGPMVQPFVEQGMLQREGDNLVFEINFEQGALSLFGKPMPMGI
jgi:uncharacterized protein YdgA (DUF945 family)